MSRINILISFKKNLISFFDELIELLPQEADLVICRIFLQDQIPIEDIMNYIIYKLIPLKGLVEKQDEKFFLENNILFEQLASDKMEAVNNFKNIWLSNSLDDDDRRTIWKWFGSFIYLAERYRDSK